jgi:hypothetical protein
VATWIENPAELNIVSRDQHRQKANRKNKKNLPDRPNIALKIESQQIKRAKQPEPAIAAYLG